MPASIPFEFLRLLGRRDATEIQRGDYVDLVTTVLFADIRDFTLASERRSAEENFRFINRYLEYMEGAISKHHGFVDQHYGDGMMALFPRRADDAVSAALEMLSRLAAFNAESAWADGAPVRIGIGINTGRLLLGTIGWERLDCGVIGDPVNVAARIDGMTKLYGAPLLVSEWTYKALEDPKAWVFREIDRAVPAGCSVPVTIFEPLEGAAAPKRATRALFEEGLASYRAGRFEEARGRFRACLAAVPDDSVAAALASRCDALLASGAPADWDGVVQLATK